jgi:hypothetical protein
MFSPQNYITWSVFEYVRDIVSERKRAVIRQIRGSNHDGVGISDNRFVNHSRAEIPRLEQLRVDIATRKARQTLRAVQYLLTPCYLVFNLGINR